MNCVPQLALSEKPSGRKLSQVSRTMLRANLGNARAAVRAAIAAANAAAAVLLDAEALAGLIGDEAAEQVLDEVGAAVLTHARALEGLRRTLDLIPLTKSLNTMTAPALLVAAE
jgi:hypothetical protein